MQFSAKGAAAFHRVLGALLIIAASGLTARAQPVFRGTLTFNGSPQFVFNFTVVLHPGQAATYEVGFRGRLLDSGHITAEPSGPSTFTGVIQSSAPRIRPCLFTVTLSGGTATGTLDPFSCTHDGLGGSFVVTQV